MTAIELSERRNLLVDRIDRLVVWRMVTARRGVFAARRLRWELTTRTEHRAPGQTLRLFPVELRILTRSHATPSGAVRRSPPDGG